jgi:carbon monoxide dehydrogenase subunit G
MVTYTLTEGKMKYREAENEAKRLTQETGIKHSAVTVRATDQDGYEVTNWTVQAQSGMTVEQGRAYLDEQAKHGAFGLTWDQIERMQGGKLRP